MRDHYKRNRSYYVEKAMKQTQSVRAKLREVILEAKKAPCVDCGRVFPPCAVDMDHVRGTKRFTISRGVWKKITIDQLKKELAKCVVRCAVCHRVKTHGCKGSCGQHGPIV